MSYRRMEQSKNRWKEKAKSKAKENRELKRLVKKLFGRLSQAKGELDKCNGAQAAPEKPAKEEKKSPNDTGSS